MIYRSATIKPSPLSSSFLTIRSSPVFPKTNGIMILKPFWIHILLPRIKGGGGFSPGWHKYTIWNFSPYYLTSLQQLSSQGVTKKEGNSCHLFAKTRMDSTTFWIRTNHSKFKGEVKIPLAIQGTEVNRTINVKGKRDVYIFSAVEKAKCISHTLPGCKIRHNIRGLVLKYSSSKTTTLKWYYSRECVQKEIGSKKRNVLELTKRIAIIKYIVVLKF